MVGGSHKKMFDIIFFPGFSSYRSPAASSLLTEFCCRSTFDITQDVKW